eukprot:TRINITY_DN10163_c0_g2_i1.p3 TRINITY_DN10163_c0_g2~~TRINITY_DN10163_c0_g2_i1.p3  ORF type:complete len:107 (-),score=38.08 TRINITY_DN10163_c0_g2_i1:59-379(-)
MQLLPGKVEPKKPKKEPKIRVRYALVPTVLIMVATYSWGFVLTEAEKPIRDWQFMKGKSNYKEYYVSNADRQDRKAQLEQRLQQRLDELQNVWEVKYEYRKIPRET